MRTSRQAALICALVAGGLSVGGELTRRHLDPAFSGFIPRAEARDVSFASPQVAYEQGLSAYRGGYYELAIPALEYVVARNDNQYRMFAEFYLGRIFADNIGAHTDHAKAYMLYQRLADEHADIDPDDVKRAPIVAKALTAVAIYVRDGLPEIALKPDQERAIEYLRHAATFFNEADAQFELAKINIADEGQRRNGLHFLQKLAKESHPGAQAVLAELMARGKYVPQEHAQALALIRMAVDNAAPADRIWIEDIYQNIFCNSDADVREKSKGHVANWRKLFSQPRAVVEQPMGLGRRADQAALARICANGERLEFKRDAAATGVMAISPSVSTVTPPAALLPSGVRESGPPQKR